VIRTAVGYSGGTSGNPTYRSIGDHSETIRIEFDPRQVSYQELLAVFWESHEPTYDVLSRQYRNAIFFLSTEQKEQAERSRNEFAARTGSNIFTAIEPAGPFYLAEDYHQKYLLRQSTGIFQALQATFPNEEAFIASTTAARLNGYLGCNGDPGMLPETTSDLGLSPVLQQRLIESVSSRCRNFRGLSCPAPR